MAARSKAQMASLGLEMSMGMAKPLTPSEMSSDVTVAELTTAGTPQVSASATVMPKASVVAVLNSTLALRYMEAMDLGVV